MDAQMNDYKTGWKDGWTIKWMDNKGWASALMEDSLNQQQDQWKFLCSFYLLFKKIDLYIFVEG